MYLYFLFYFFKIVFVFISFWLFGFDSLTTCTSFKQSGIWRVTKQTCNSIFMLMLMFVKAVCCKRSNMKTTQKSSKTEQASRTEMHVFVSWSGLCCEGSNSMKTTRKFWDGTRFVDWDAYDCSFCICAGRSGMWLPDQHIFHCGEWVLREVLLLWHARWE